MNKAVYLPESVKRVEQAWAEQHENSTWPLMVAAAQSFVHRFLEAFLDKKILVICGNGNNGGDGFYIAKLLIDAGLSVSVIAPLDIPRPQIDASKALQAFSAAGGEIQQAYSLADYDLVIDALFGIGLSRSLNDSLVTLIEQVNASGIPVYSVDIPSGLNAVNGLALPIAFQATATHSFIGYKPGLLTNLGPACCGELRVDALGTESVSDMCYQPDMPELPQRFGNTHKSRHGVVRILGGFGNMPGAGLIAAKAALHAGAGKVFWHSTSPHIGHFLSDQPELMISPGIPLEKKAEDVLVIGPGLGRAEDQKVLMGDLLSSHSRGVIDADALRLLADRSLSLKGWVLTPHESEAAGLLDESALWVQANRLEAVRRIADRFSTVAVLKGTGTLVSDGSTTTICHSGDAKMATPGMGDALAGMIGALIANGMALKDAAIAGVNWHAQTGAKLAQTQRLVLATDIIDSLRRL